MKYILKRRSVPTVAIGTTNPPPITLADLYARLYSIGGVLKANLTNGDVVDSTGASAESLNGRTTPVIGSLVPHPP